MKKYFYLLATLPLTMAMVACQSDSEPGQGDENKTEVVDKTPAKIIQLNKKETDLVTAQNNAALKIFNAFLAENQGEEYNMCVSPLSIEMVISMLANGADAETVNRTLDLFEVNNLDELNTFNNRLMTELPQVQPNLAKLSFNNGLWVNTLYSLTNDFKSTLSSTYTVDVFDADFSKNDIRSLINNWVNAKTNGLIPKISDLPVNSGFPLMMANALYMEAKFDIPFDEKATEKVDFFNANNEKLGKVKMMSNCGMYNYTADQDFDAVKMTYGNNGFEMWAILPHQGISVSAVADKLSTRGIDYLAQEAKEGYLSVKLPRFETGNSYCITDLMESFGLKYNEKTLGGISNSPQFDFEINHATHLQMSETGVKAAAVTNNETYWANEPTPVAKFNFDHPFIYVIREVSTGVVLFTGIYATPTEE
ncbi:MAG: hypothetical protein J6C44_04520 [Muribaculaceae bacterium]|nr:hypothetical protein [Muribaculaceae bacterium]